VYLILTGKLIDIENQKIDLPYVEIESLVKARFGNIPEVAQSLQKIKELTSKS